jgi:hypothetical protein
MIPHSSTPDVAKHHLRGNRSAAASAVKDASRLAADAGRVQPADGNDKTLRLERWAIRAQVNG